MAELVVSGQMARGILTRRRGLWLVSLLEKKGRGSRKAIAGNEKEGEGPACRPEGSLREKLADGGKRAVVLPISSLAIKAHNGKDSFLTGHPFLPSQLTSQPSCTRLTR